MSYTLAYIENSLFAKKELLLLRCIYISEFRKRFCIKLARFAQKFLFITKRASLVRNHLRNGANVNTPLRLIQGILTEGEGSVQLTS
jgi:hypothetical protein